MLSATPETLPDGTKAPAPPLSVPAIMTAGGGAGIAMWSLGIPPDVSGFFFFWPFLLWPIKLVEQFAHPLLFFLSFFLQTIKSRLQSAPQGTYTGFMDCARKLIAQDGVTALWKGFGPAMARAVPANVSRICNLMPGRGGGGGRFKKMRKTDTECPTRLQRSWA